MMLTSIGYDSDGNEHLVWPEEDKKDHTPSTLCLCNPSLYAELRNKDAYILEDYYYYFVHNSLRFGIGT